MSGQFSAQAQNQALGYLYQVRYALLLLIKTGIADPDAKISIEYLDDIAFEHDGIPSELIQTKHHINTKASLTDSSTDLWKTLRIWSEAHLQGKLQASNLSLTLITTEHAAANSAAYKLRPAASGSRNVGEALEILLNIAQSSANKVNEPAYKVFKGLSSNQQRTLLANVQILDGSPNILDVHKEILNHLRIGTRENHLLAVCRRLEGWWFEITIRHLSAKTYNVISFNDLNIVLEDIRQQFYEENLPIDFPDPIEVEEQEAVTDQRVFVEQLRLVNARIMRIQKAISDFYRSSAQRSEWVRDGVLGSKELQYYEGAYLTNGKDALIVCRKKFLTLRRKKNYKKEEEICLTI